MKVLQGHMPFYIAAACGILALLPALWLKPEYAVQAAANGFFIVYLALEFRKIPTLTPEFLKKYAATADEPAWLIITIAFAALLVAVGGLFIALNEGTSPNPLTVALALASVALGWVTIHTMAAVHYAHLYWRPDESAGAEPDGGAEPHGGLDFPGDDEPGGYDFLYFSMVTGMTAQTADVAITKTRMRKLNMLHGVVSFFFNTVLVAAAVNAAVSLAN